MSNGNRKSNPNIPNIALTFYDVLGRVTPYILMYFESMELKPRFFALVTCIDKNIVAQDYTDKYITCREIIKYENAEGHLIHLIAVHS